MTYNIEVENIKCGGCMNSIKTTLLKLEGVKDVHIDQEIDTIVVESHTEREILIQALSKMGYPEKGKNTMIHKAKSMVSCAIGKIN